MKKTTQFQQSQTEQIQYIDISLIDPKSKNYRGDVTTEKPDEQLQELAQSIQSHGILQPILLRAFNDSYQVVCADIHSRMNRVRF